jgi:hypothetical protein
MANEIKIFENEEKKDIKFPELLDYEEILYTPQQLEDINKDEGDKLASDLNKITDTSDDLPQGAMNKYDDQDASSRAKTGLTAAGFVQKVIQGSNITGTPTVGINITNVYMGYYNGTTWPVYIKNDGKFMFQGDAGNYITWDGSVLNIRGQLNADDINAGTLTARKYRTAVSGSNRLELLATGYAHYITWWNTANNLQSFIVDDWSGHLALHAPTYVYIDPKLEIYGNLNVTGYITVPTLSLYPYSSIGYIQHGDYALFRTPASSTDIEVGGHFYPINDAGPYLGKSDRRWYSLYTQFANIDYLGKALNANTYNITNIGSVGCVSVSASGNIIASGTLQGGSGSSITGTLYVYSLYCSGAITVDELKAYQSGRIILYNHLRPNSAAAQINLGDATYYYNEIFAKYFTDVGCLGDFSEGAELLNGKKVSDLEALKQIKKTDKLTRYGVPMLNYKTLPKGIYRAPNTKNGVDGADLSALISLSIGAIKELDDRLEKVESNN